MARPKSFDRDAAIDIVMNEIWRNGVTATSVKSLSETLGITRSSFYNAFGSWDDLLREVFDRYNHQAPSSALMTIAPTTPVKRFVTDLFREICRVRAADPEGRGCLGVNYIAEAYSKDDALAQSIEEGTRYCIDRFRQLLTAGIASGELPPDTAPEPVALALQNLMVGLNVFSKIIRDEQELWATARTTLQGLGVYAQERV